jgi:hypothetical protein
MSAWGAPSVVRRAVRVLAWAVVLVLGATGIVTADSTVVMLVILAAVLGVVGGAVAAKNGGDGAVARGGARRPVLMGAVTGPCLILVVAGLGAIVGPVAVPIVALTVGLWAWRRWRGDGGSGVEPAEPADSLTTLTNAELGRAWRRSHARLSGVRDAGELERVCLLRRRQLDEMERRDPVGFRRWLGSGSWVMGDSAPFLGG